MDGMSRQVEANLAALIESTDDLIWSVDLNFQLLAFNSALQADFQDNFGVRIDVGMKAEDYLPPSRSVLWTPLYTRALREGPFKADYPLADGRLLELAFNPIVVDGKKTGVSVFGKDITERKRSELERAERAERHLVAGA